ncbi:hypothetical protein DWX95_02335 [Butyricicoccus sp. AF22-28AC]|nr:hypothetical protein DWX95_02335 [Butyricicoccus sp. AF22-28AC]
MAALRESDKESFAEIVSKLETLTEPLVEAQLLLNAIAKILSLIAAFIAEYWLPIFQPFWAVTFMEEIFTGLLS